MKIISISQARFGASRLPGKVLLPVEEHTLLGLHLERVQCSSLIQKALVATSTEPQDQPIVDHCQQLKVPSFTGSEEDVLDRFYQLIQRESPDYVVRLTCDCPLVDPQIIDHAITFAVENSLDYVSATLQDGYADGLDVEVCSSYALCEAWRKAKKKSHREHVTPYIYLHSNLYDQDIFRADILPGDGYGAHLRMTVDTAEDLEVIRILVRELGPMAEWRSYVTYLLEHPNLQKINDSNERDAWLQEI